jgi:hypothetical protein
MRWPDIFDLVRHVVELFFYLVTGPLATLFIVKQLKRQRRIDQQLLDFQQRLAELSSAQTNRQALPVGLATENTRELVEERK